MIVWLCCKQNTAELLWPHSSVYSYNSFWAIFFIEQKANIENKKSRYVKEGDYIYTYIYNYIYITQSQIKLIKPVQIKGSGWTPDPLHISMDYWRRKLHSPAERWDGILQLGFRFVCSCGHLYNRHHLHLRTGVRL